MLHPKQKALLHIYKQAAGINDPTYRNILREYAGVSSAADKRMNQDGFERAMAGLEAILFRRVDAGDVENPIGHNRWIRQEYYWRNKVPATGYINSRQAHTIEDLWKRLCEHLPHSQRHVRYLTRIISKATGKSDVGYSALTIQEAGYLIDALKDRLAYAIRKPRNKEPAPF